MPVKLLDINPLHPPVVSGNGVQSSGYFPFVTDQSFCIQLPALLSTKTVIRVVIEKPKDAVNANHKVPVIPVEGLYRSWVMTLKPPHLVCDEVWYGVTKHTLLFDINP